MLYSLEKIIKMTMCCVYIGDLNDSNKTGLPNTEQQVTEVQDFVSQLDEHTQYALVATEL